MSTPSAVTGLELRRLIDGHVYRFARTTDSQERACFKRDDGDYWIVWHEKLGWIAGNWDSNDVFGRPWDQLAPQTAAAPPEGIWVSRKGPKAYVYDLVYTEMM